MFDPLTIPLMSDWGPLAWVRSRTSRSSCGPTHFTICKRRTRRKILVLLAPRTRQ